MRAARIIFLCTALILAFAVLANADQINFTGGTVTLWDGTVITNATNNSIVRYGVSTYQEGNYLVTFLGDHAVNVSNPGFESIIGNYESSGNDIIHGHWANGHYGKLNKIFIQRTDGAEFDLNYFLLTSNTGIGGAGPTGFEQTYIHASSTVGDADGVGLSDDYSQLLPPDAWGWPETNIVLGSHFDGVRAFWFDSPGTGQAAVDCFGMDMFYIDEPPPPGVPEPGSIALLSMMLLGSAGFGLARRRRV